MDADDRHGRVGDRPARPVVSGSAIGDFLRAVAALRAHRDATARAELAAIFGLQIRPAAIAKGEPQPPPIGGDPGGGAGQRGRGPTGPPVPPRHQAAAGNPIPATVRGVEVVDRAVPPWLEAATALPPRSPAAPMPKMSLLEPKWTRAILTTAVAAPAYVGEPDVVRLVEQFAAGEPVRALPLRAILTLARGAYCWVDRSRAMEPFAGDQAQFVAELRNVVGPSRLDVRSTDGVPFQSADLLPGVPHLLLSDLGAATVGAAAGDVESRELGDPPDAWARWAEWVTRDLGSRVLALVPRRRRALPLRVRRIVHVLEWDRHTSVGSVRRVLAGADD